MRKRPCWLRFVGDIGRGEKGGLRMGNTRGANVDWMERGDYMKMVM